MTPKEVIKECLCVEFHTHCVLRLQCSILSFKSCVQDEFSELGTRPLCGTQYLAFFQRRSMIGTVKFLAYQGHVPLHIASCIVDAFQGHGLVLKKNESQSRSLLAIKHTSSSITSCTHTQHSLLESFDSSQHNMSICVIFFGHFHCSSFKQQNHVQFPITYM